MTFRGFVEEDFEAFAIPDFAGRMGAIRARVRPRLIELGEDLAGKIEAVVSMPTHPHVAQHTRRRVNPPEETWVAFGRDRKGYKRWTHYRIAISGAGLRVTVFIEDDADDKEPFGARLESSAGELLEALGAAPVEWYTLASETVNPGILEGAGKALQRTKTLKFQAGIPLPRGQAAGMDPARFGAWALEQAAALKPLYLLGTG